jgi:thiamine biosynthesis lipoprotein
MKGSDRTARFAALGGIATIAVTQPDALALARATVERTVAEFDLACSRFRQDSELAALNRAQGAPVRVSPLFLEALQAGLRAARLTDGDVDPTIGNALIALGYDRDFAALQARTDRPATLPRPQISPIRVAGWRTVVLDARAGTVRLPPGVTLDLGATAKALAADRAAQNAHEAAGCGVLVSLSGDIAIAGPAPPSGWRVRVTDDHRSGFDAPGQSIALRSGGLATSSTTVRRWRHQNIEAHHLLDPATGRPAAVSWRTVSVAAARCLDANIATTAAIVRGARARQWLESLRLPSRLVAANGTVTHAGGWPDEGEEPDHRPAVPSITAAGQDLR